MKGINLSKKGGNFMHYTKKSLLLASMMAMLAATPMPIFAANMAKPVQASATGGIVQQSADGHRRRWRHRDRVDAGDILTGIGILAGIAIIADAASDADKRERNDDRYENRDNSRNDRPVYQDDDLGTAVSSCTDAAERSVGNGARVNEIRSVTRDGDGWRVEGDLQSDSFTCAATNGRVDYIRVNDRAI
jgi:hypothetical protein